MAARNDPSAVDAPRPLRPARFKASASGRHVIDLTQLPPPDVRMAAYEEAFGMPSALHQQSLPVVRPRRGVSRLRSLVSRRARG